MNKKEAEENAKNQVRLSEIIKKNVETVVRIEKASLDARTQFDRLADKIANFCGSITFVLVHVVWFSTWLLVNWLPIFSKTLRFDPPPFGILTLIVSLEAIFLSNFILISQNRQQKVADQRNHLDLQINLLAEQEASQVLIMLGQLLEHHGLSPEDPRGHAMKRETDTTLLAESISMEELDN
jgi:uncharacterized membrane protein